MAISDRKKYKRLQFEFSEDAVNRLDNIVYETDSATRAEAVRNALRLYDYVIRQVSKGYSMYFENEEGRKHQVPILR